MGRTLRRYARAKGLCTERRVPRGATADGEVKFRKVRRRSAARFASCSGYLTDNDAPRLALALARLVERGPPLWWYCTGVLLDRALSVATAWNDRYHSTRWWHKIHLVARFFVLRKDYLATST